MNYQYISNNIHVCSVECFEMLRQSDTQWNKFHTRFHETWPIYSDVIGWVFVLSFSEVM
jgi:hypothetical protein